MLNSRRSSRSCAVPEDYGQSTIEFTFAMIMLMFLLYGLVQSARWVVLDSAERHFQHDEALMNLTDVQQQLNPKRIYYYRPDLEYRSTN